MKVTSSILQSEFIGLKARVVKSSNPNYRGISGKVLDETRNTFKILHEEKEKVIVKEASVFHFTLPDGTVIEVCGKVLVGCPEDRVKKVVRRRW
ncbi:MAG: ribonuclease P protein component 1 [Nitrososphaerota archaeon]